MTKLQYTAVTLSVPHKNIWFCHLGIWRHTCTKCVFLESIFRLIKFNCLFPFIGKALKGDGLLPDIHVRYGEDDENQGELSEGEGHSGRRGYDLDLNDVEVHIQGQGEIDEEDGSAYYHGQQGHGGGRRKKQRGSLAVSRSGGTNWSKSHSDNAHKSGYNTSDGKLGVRKIQDNFNEICNWQISKGDRE